MNLTMDAYLEYLKNAYDQVVAQTIQDESLPVLAEMENKNFYTSRINQLFTQLYTAERQNKIISLIQEVQQLKKKQIAFTQLQAMSKIQKQCLKCKLRQQKQFQTKLSQIQPDLLKQNLSFALKQNEMLSQELRQIQQNNLSQVKTLFNSNETVQRKMATQLQQLQKQLQIQKKMYKQLKLNYNREVKELQNVRSQLLNQKQQNIKLQGKQRQYQKKTKYIQGDKEKLIEQINNLKKSKDILEDKIRRLEDEKGLQKQRIYVYEQQIKNLQVHNLDQQIKANNKIIHREIDGDKGLESLVSKLAVKQLEIKKMFKQKIQLKQENQTLQSQLMNYKITYEKSIQQLKQNFNKSIIQYERQLRSFRQKDLQGINLIKQQQITSKIHQMNQIKEKLKKVETDKFLIENQLLKLTNQNRTLTQNYEHINQTFRQQKLIYEQKLEIYEKKLEQYKKLEKQLTKRAKMKEDQQNNILEQQLKSKIKFYEDKLKDTQQKLILSKKSQEKLERNIQILNKQLNSKPLKDKNQLLIIRQHQLMLRVSDLQNTLTQTKMVSSELMNKKQQKIRTIKKQVQSKQQQITQLKFKFQNATKTIIQLDTNLKNTQIKLRQEQQRLVNLQQKNRAQMLQMMKNNEQKVQNLTQQFQRYHNTISKTKTNSNDKSLFPNALKSLQKQYQQKINNLQHQWSQFKSKNLLLQEKNKQNQEAIAQYKDTIRNATNQWNKFRDLSVQYQNLLQKQKNKQVMVVKYYQEKISGFKNMFKEFKFQICCQFLQAISTLKSDLSYMKKETLQLTQNWKKFMLNGKFEIQQRIIFFKSMIQKNYEQESDKSNFNIILKLERQKQQMIINYQNKLKQRQLDLMTIVAQKQFTIQQVKQIENNLNKKYRDLQNNFKKVQTKLQKAEASEIQLKEIISKMESKVDEAEKNQSIKQKQVYQLQKIIQQLNEKVIKSQTFYRQQINDCKLKYREENERMYNRFQRQFNKIINISSKKGKDKSSLLSPTSGKGFQIPTKGDHQEDKISKLKREIQQQKKIVEKLQSHKKY